MDCPDCGATCSCIDTRKRPDNTTRRRWECKACGRRYSSVECMAVNTTTPYERCRSSRALKADLDMSPVADKLVYFAGWRSRLTDGRYISKQDAMEATISELEKLFSVSTEES